MAKIATIVARLREYGSLWFMRGVVVLILAFLFFVAGGGISQNDRWKIDRIEVSGAQIVERDAIEVLVREKLKGNYYFVYARENSFLFPRDETEQELLRAFPRLANVYAERVNAHTIAITVTERKPYALWCGEVYSSDIRELSNCFFIDDSGFVFDHAPIFSQGVYLEIYGKLNDQQNKDALRAHIPQSSFSLFYDVVRTLAREVGEPVRVVLKPKGEVGVTISTSVSYPMLVNTEVRFKDTMSAEIIIENLLAALPVQFPPGVTSKKKLLYIDMRFGNKIFFGFEN